MNQQIISQDDVFDVMEMTKKLQNYHHRIFKDNELHLVMSALVNSSVKSIVSQCKSVDEIIFFKSIFNGTFDMYIKKVKEMDEKACK